MTEERMIRVTKPDALAGEVTIRVFFDYYRPNGRIAKDGFSINDFDGLEPAPPKDWKPTCYNQCRGGKKDWMAYGECKLCPYRKMEALK